MRYPTLILLSSLLLASSGKAQNLVINPTTTLAAQTGNNTSAADTFGAQTNGNTGAANVSKINVHSLLYAGATTKVYAHFMPWWGDKRHIKVGYNSHDPAQIHRQIADMISRGIDGTIIDWYGPADYTDQTAKLVMAEVEQHPDFGFAVMVDKGAISLSPCSGCNPQQTLISLVQYVEQTYVNSPAYIRINGRPLITNFDMDLHYNVNWTAVQAASNTNPAFIFQHKGGFTHPESGGSYSWVIVNVTDEGMNYLSQFYAGGKAAPHEETIGAAYKGFNDTLASWGENRIMNQQCGQTWLQTFSKINSLYNSTNQLDALQLVTWNDYEEGTELETGIDNCASVSAQVSGSVLNWNLKGNENTIDHYVVYISNDGNNLMPLNTAGTGSNSLDLCSYGLASGNYSAFVQAVGKPNILNKMSGKVQYTAQCSGSGTGGSGSGSGGPGPGGPGPVGPGSGGSGSGPVVSPILGASPSVLELRWGQSGKAQISVKGSQRKSISLSCSHLPAGVSCSFSPAVLPSSSSGSSTLTFVTKSRSLPRSDPSGLAYNFLFPGFGLAGFAFSGRLLTRKKLGKVAVLSSLLLASMLLSSCGGGTITPPAQTTAAAAAESYAITLQASDGSSTTTTKVTLKLK